MAQATQRWRARIFASPTKSTPSHAAPPKHDGRFVTVGPLILFSTDTGDAWLLDPADHLAARLARDGDPEPIYFEETATNSRLAERVPTTSIAKHSSTSTMTPAESSPSSAILPAELLDWANLKISNMFG